MIDCDKQHSLSFCFPLLHMCMYKGTAVFSRLVTDSGFETSHKPEKERQRQMEEEGGGEKELRRDCQTWSEVRTLTQPSSLS